MAVSDFVKGLEEQKRVVVALFLRELKTRFGETRLGYLWAFLEPMFHISIFLFLITFIRHIVNTQVDPVLFLITGIVPFFLFRNTVLKVMNSVRGNKALLVFPQINIMDFVISRAVLEFVIYFVVGCILLLIAYYSGYEVKIEYPLGVLAGFVLIWLLGAALGFVLISAIAVVPIIEKVVQVVMRALYLTSGVIFSISRIPTEYQDYLIWNPILQICELIRGNFFVEITANPDHIHIKYILMVIGVLMLYGFVLKNKFMRYILND